ncbi:MAG: hypothetical protein K8F62_17315 [Pseudorhodoplanes sp.]|nr:hypothetical protein [Pseudorhodoplanes sp.]
MTVVAASVVAAFLAMPGRAAASSVAVHDGMTPQQLVAFAVSQGWRAETDKQSANVTIHIGDESVHVTMLECEAAGRCRSGIIRRITYHSLELPNSRCHVWHWNQEAHGATGFGPDYVTLQRYIQFRGVNDRYLRDAFDIWLRVLPSFRKLLEDCGRR